LFLRLRGWLRLRVGLCPCCGLGAYRGRCPVCYSRGPEGEHYYIQIEWPER
jgi:hypothetical protein